MGDVRDILRGGLMSQSHPLPSSDGPHSPTAHPWRWSEYRSNYRPFSQYSYCGGSWHRNAPLDTTDGPSSWYAEVAERIHKAEEYKTRSRSSGIGETDYPSERNRLIWSNSVSALPLHDTVDSGAGHRRQKSRFQSLGPAFSQAKDSQPMWAPATTGRTASKPRTSRSVSRKRPESKDVPDSQKAGATSPTKTVARAQSTKPPPKKEPETKDVKTAKPRAVVKPTPAKEGDKIKEDKKWIKPVPSDTIDAKAKDTIKDTKSAAEKVSPKSSDTPAVPAKSATPASTPTATPITKPPTPTATSPPAKIEPTPKPAPVKVPQPAKPTEILKPTPAPIQPVKAAPLASEPVQPSTKPTVPEPTAKPAAERTDTKPSAVATPLIPQAPKTAPVDPMAQSFMDHSTIGGGGPVSKTAPKPADFSMARSRLDEFWAEGK